MSRRGNYAAAYLLVLLGRGGVLQATRGLPLLRGRAPLFDHVMQLDISVSVAIPSL